MRQIALIATSLVILGLFKLERDREARASSALWLPVIWLFLGASRAVSLWLGNTAIMESPDQYLEGSPLDRTVYAILLGATVLVLVRRRTRTLAFLRANPLILVFLLYCAASVLWSDFPLVAFKRWAKTVGNVAVVLVALTDDEPLTAIKRLFSRTGFLMIPTSILLIKYYPEFGRGYSVSGQTFYSGVSTDKNGLGVICMIWGLFSLWRFVVAYRDKNASGRAGTLAAHGAILVMIVWLLSMADSSTSTVCLIVGSGLLILGPGIARRGSAGIHALIATLACVALLPYAFQDVWESFTQSLGRHTDLTGRTELWTELLQFNVNPWIGTGFESFWLGDRARHFWEEYWWHPNQAHNGYLETYLNLGWIGVVLLVLLMAIAYRNAIRAFQRNVPWAPLLLPFVVIVVIYNVTEAAFKVTHPVYIAFLFPAIALPAIGSQTRADPTAEPAWPMVEPIAFEADAFESYDEVQLTKADSIPLES